jgi:hypothetical protein
MVEEETARRWRIEMHWRSSGASVLALVVAQTAATPILAQAAGDGTLTCGESYVVQPGDTLSEIAQRAYGMSEMYDRLIDANSDQISRADMLSVGMQLLVPCLDDSGAAILADIGIGDAIAAEGPLSAQELDALFGPVALFPDEVLTPILYAVTLPLDIVKAGRFVAESAELSDQDRAAAAAEQPWDESVRELAAGFPDLVTRMSDHIDWTEQAGEAVLVQTDDVLDSIQRLRAQAMDNGYLEDNQAQTVEVVNDTIAIAPAQAGVVYVPTYDYQTVYTTPVAAPAYYYDDDDFYGDWESALVGGAIFMGSAIILDDIFDDDDWDGIGGWDDDDVEIDWDRGDITIERRDIDRGDRDLTIEGGDRVEIGSGDRTTIGNGDRISLGGDRTQIGAGDRTIRETTDTASREAARQRIETRQEADREVARLPANRPEVNRPRAETRPAAGNREEVRRPNTERRPTTTRPQQQVQRPNRQDNAFDRPPRQSTRDAHQRTQNRPNQGNRRR